MRTSKRRARLKPRLPKATIERSDWIPAFLDKYSQTGNLIEAAEVADVCPVSVNLRRKNDDLFSAQCGVAWEKYIEGARKMVNFYRGEPLPNLRFTLEQAKATLPEWGRNNRAPVEVIADKVVLLPAELRERWRERLKV